MLAESVPSSLDVVTQDLHDNSTNLPADVAHASAGGFVSSFQEAYRAQSGPPLVPLLLAVGLSLILIR